MRVIKVTTDNKIYIIDIDVNDVKAVHEEIGGFECVRTKEIHQFFQENVTMIVDDDGFAKEKSLNIIASALYGFGNIVGDVLFVPEEHGVFVEFFDVDAQCHYMNALNQIGVVA